MKILILGNDGYIGYPLTIHLLEKDHEVFGVDDLSRRRRVKEVGSDSLTPIANESARRYHLKIKYKNYIEQVNLTLGGDPPSFINSVLRSFKPDAIVHLAEQPSAPWSMKSVEFAVWTQSENVMGTLQLLWAMKKECPDAHLVKLGTMGEYGTPDCDIPEGEIPEDCIGGLIGVGVFGEGACPMTGLPFPRSANSFYHLSKVHDTHNIIFACKTWNLRSTDIMQGVVFGLNNPETEDELTRFDYDEYFGTVINRFCAQAIIGHNLTVYGTGHQKRGFLPLKDSIQCLTIALENPPEKGEYRTFNQFERVCSIIHLAETVVHRARILGLYTAVSCIDNPRNEAEDHYYNPTHEKLFNLGYIPTMDIAGEIHRLIEQLIPYKDRVNEKVILPTTKWNEGAINDRP